MRIETRQIADLTAADRGAWRHLAEAAIEPNPFFEEPFVAAAATLPRPAAALALAFSGDELVACLPLHRPNRWRRVPLPVLASWQGDHGFLGTPLVAQGHLDAIEPLFGHLLADRRAGLLMARLLTDGPAGQATARALGAGGRPLADEPFERAALHRRPDDDYVADTLAGKHRKELRRTRRRLEEELGAALEIADVAGDPAAAEEFLALEASGWKGTNGTAIASAPGGREFFGAMCRAFAAGGRLNLLRMHSAGRTVAMKCNLHAEQGTFCFKIAFDESLARFSPGVQLEIENVSHFHHATRAQWMDSCADFDNEMINRLWPDRRALVNLVVPAGGAAGLIAAPAARGVSAVRERVRSGR